uniref:Uncharacterized protein n=1 Tax=Rhizophora mucronata TaxID=61149 RepID=A0A2P2Q7Z9_RHIMU
MKKSKGGSLLPTKYLGEVLLSKGAYQMELNGAPKMRGFQLQEIS